MPDHVLDFFFLDLDVLSDLLLEIHAGLGIVSHLGKKLALDIFVNSSDFLQGICFGIHRIVSIVEYIGEELLWNNDDCFSLSSFCSTCFLHIL